VADWNLMGIDVEFHAHRFLLLGDGGGLEPEVLDAIPST